MFLQVAAIYEIFQPVNWNKWRLLIGNETNAFCSAIRDSSWNFQLLTWVQFEFTLHRVVITDVHVVRRYRYVVE